MVNIANNFLHNLKYRTKQRGEHGSSVQKIEEFPKLVNLKKDYQKIYSNILKEFTELAEK
ncbi:MAG: hypothetical protein KGD63_07525 [Candidatus Lokiarchaeota archaeon]|nr:hypothetical protein [Candidatus Lokiarchaeota archaeon]